MREQLARAAEKELRRPVAWDSFDYKGYDPAQVKIIAEFIWVDACGRANSEDPKELAHEAFTRGHRVELAIRLLQLLEQEANK